MINAMSRDAVTQEETVDTNIGTLLELSGVIQLLRGCVLAQSYAVPDDLASSIKLTPFGDTIHAELRRKHRRTRPNEAILAVALAIGVGDDLLVDPERSDIEALRASLTSEIKRKRLLFPDPYQRGFAEELFVSHEYSSNISAPEAVKFLKDKEQGVYQVGRSSVGPWGCVVSDQFRMLEPSGQVYGFYCDNHWCARIHTFTLETARNAPINRAQADLRPILDDHRRTTPSRRLRTFQIESAKLIHGNPFVDSAQLLNLIGDALNDDERVQVAAIALRRQLKLDAGFRSWVSSVSSRMLLDPLQFVLQLSFGEVMQLFHLMNDDILVRSVDEAALSGAIRTDPDLRRTARIERWSNRGVTAEVGTKGLRFRVPPDQENVILGHILHRVYVTNPDDLAFALDRPAGESLDSLISHAFQTMEVDDVADTCLINDRRAAAAACSLVHVDHAGKNRAEIADLLKWRLGISNEVVASGSQSLVAAADEYLAASPERSVEEKRGALSNFYVDLETELMLAIRFAEWALVSDHYVNTPRFSLRLGDLPNCSPCVVDRDGNPIKSRPTLQPLAASFAKLADRLERMPTLKRELDSVPAHRVGASIRVLALVGVSRSQRGVQITGVCRTTCRQSRTGRSRRACGSQRRPRTW